MNQGQLSIISLLLLAMACPACSGGGEQADEADETTEVSRQDLEAAEVPPVDVEPADIPPFDIKGMEDIAQFDALSLFTFLIFSDNKGGGPEELLSMAAVVNAVVDMDARFALGLGDHLKSGDQSEQGFVPFIIAAPWWYDGFYPCVADGENAYYGSGQGDWGAGAGLVDAIEVCQRAGVTCRDNHAEYHAVMQFDDVTVHFVSAHYPDVGDDPFPQSSQDYLVEEVAGIERTGREIIIAAAHTGDWLKKMSSEDKDLLLTRADLLLGATTHVFERYNYTNDRALFVNTGSAGWSPLNNYLQVNIIDHPLRLVLQNMDAEDERVLQAGGNCLVKEIGGKIEPCDFENGSAWGLFGDD